MWQRGRVLGQEKIPSHRPAVIVDEGAGQGLAASPPRPMLIFKRQFLAPPTLPWAALVDYPYWINSADLGLQHQLANRRTRAHSCAGKPPSALRPDWTPKTPVCSHPPSPLCEPGPVETRATAPPETKAGRAATPTPASDPFVRNPVVSPPQAQKKADHAFAQNPHTPGTASHPVRLKIRIGNQYHPPPRGQRTFHARQPITVVGGAVR